LIIPANLENVSDGFNEPKKKILYYLKVMQQAGLEELAKVMKVSRMAVHKHLFFCRIEV
jgi:predicted ArsR family transcriptional regulator